jgi:hypothetical protein
MADPIVFRDPYFGEITDTVIAALSEDKGVGNSFEVREDAADFADRDSVNKFVSRVSQRPHLLVNIEGGEVANNEESTATSVRESIRVSVSCAVSNPRSVTEQKRTAMGAYGYARRKLAGLRLSGEHFAAASLAYDGWSMTINEIGLCIVAVSFRLTTNTDA